MGRHDARQLRRDEIDLLTYYRALPVEKQLTMLELLEDSYNRTMRMQELADRSSRTGVYFDEQGRA